MLILFLGCFTMRLWMMLPIFQKYMLSTSFELKCLDLLVSLFIHWNSPFHTFWP
jgi:hypothetical protein